MGGTCWTRYDSYSISSKSFHAVHRWVTSHDVPWWQFLHHPAIQQTSSSTPKVVLVDGSVMYSVVTCMLNDGDPQFTTVESPTKIPHAHPQRVVTSGFVAVFVAFDCATEVLGCEEPAAVYGPATRSSCTHRFVGIRTEWVCENAGE